jgi:hypothetical protein
VRHLPSWRARSRKAPRPTPERGPGPAPQTSHNPAMCIRCAAIMPSILSCGAIPISPAIAALYEPSHPLPSPLAYPRREKIGTTADVTQIGRGSPAPSPVLERTCSF